MIDGDNLVIEAERIAERYQRRNHLTCGILADLFLELGLNQYHKDRAIRLLNNQRPVCYLANWHLRQGIKYYQQDLEGRT